MELNPSIVANEIISHINDMVILPDRDLRIVSINAAAGKVDLVKLAGMFNLTEKSL